MANTLYPSALSGFPKGEIDWLTDTITAYLLDGGATYNPANALPADLTGQTLGSGVLTGKTVVGGVADAGDVTVTLATPGTVRALVIASNLGGLIYWADENSDTTPISVPFDGNPIVVTWPAGGQGIFKL